MKLELEELEIGAGKSPGGLRVIQWQRTMVRSQEKNGEELKRHKARMRGSRSSQEIVLSRNEAKYN